MRAPLQFRQPLAIFALAIAGVAFPAHPAESPPDLSEWEHPAPPEPNGPVRETGGHGGSYPGLDCDPDALIWKRLCPDCISNRPLEHCSDAALR